MRRLVARFDADEHARDAEAALRDHDLEPDGPTIENPFFDPTAPVPEATALAWGAILGGVIGLVFFQAINVDLLWVPRWSPMMSADEFAVPFLGLGAAIGWFVGGVIGTLRPVPELTGTEVMVEAPDDRVNEAVGLLQDRGATVVQGTVTYHENPQPG